MFPEKIIQSTPHSPGVYLMLDSKSTVLYVGKAKDLHKRLSSYARHSGENHNKTTVMLSKVAKVDTIITITEKEALILEASLIKKHKPRYNIILRDDKNYPYIKLTISEEWPRVMMSRRKRKDNARYFGPYSSSSAMWTTLKLISSLFPLRQCKGEKLKQRKRPCLNKQIGKCLAPCTGKTDREEYQANVAKTIMVLEGKNKALIKELEKQMNEASEALEFEKAGRLRDQIKALQTTLEKQLIAAAHTRNQDVFGFNRKGTSVAISILFIREGFICGSRSFLLDDPFGLDSAVISQILIQFYGIDSLIPKEIILPIRPEDIRLLEEHLTDIADKKVKLICPRKGDKLRLIEMANNNAKNIFQEQEKKKTSWKKLRDNIQQKLNLLIAPERIECLDISNISGTNPIGSLVSFAAGEPDPKNFRHYHIKTVQGPDDYSMMREVLERRFTRAIKENTLPDLFVVDGGKGQLNIAISVTRKLGISQDIELVGIAKERKNEGEKLYRPGRKNPILLPAHNPVLLYFMRIRDESHRYGVTFHRKIRNKKTLTSELDTIEGVGKEKKEALLKTIGSLKKIRNASITELQAVDGIGPKLAQKIFSHFQKS